MNLKFQINIKLNAIDLNKVFGIPLNINDNILIYIRNEMIKITFDNDIKNRTSGIVQINSNFINNDIKTVLVSFKMENKHNLINELF